MSVHTPQELEVAIRVYGGVAGSRAFRTIWMLEELGLEYENVPIHFASGETRQPDYLALNPNGKVPTLVDGEIVIWESLAINLYLARTYDRGLQPLSVAGNAETLKWSFWVMTEVEVPHDVARRAGTTMAPQELQRACGILDQALRGKSYLVEERFTVADLNLAAVLSRPSFPRIDLSGCADFERWRSGCLSRPACMRARQVVSAAPQPPRTDNPT